MNINPEMIQRIEINWNTGETKDLTETIEGLRARIKELEALMKKGEWLEPAPLDMQDRFYAYRCVVMREPVYGKGSVVI